MRLLLTYMSFIILMCCAVCLSSCNSSKHYPLKNKHQTKMKRKYRKYDCRCYIYDGWEKFTYLNSDGQL
jgi:hypothetical protein